MIRQRLNRCDNIPHSMVKDWVTLFLHSTPRFLCIVYNQHVVSIDIQGFFDRNPHYPQLVLDPMECFHSVFHCHKLCTKNWCLNRSLLLGRPLDQSCVHEDKEPITWPTCWFSLAWLLSTCILNYTLLNLGSDMLVRIAYFTSPYN